MTDVTTLNPLLVDVLTDLKTPLVLWQVGVLMLALGLAWGMTRIVRSYTKRLKKASGRGDVAGHLRQVAGVSDVVFPLLGWAILTGIVQIANAYHERINVLRVAAVLLLAAALIRLVFYAVRRAFRPSPLVGGFQRVFAVVVWIVVALHVCGLLPEVIDAMSEIVVLNDVAGTKETITLWQILTALFWIWVTLIGALWGGATLEARLMGDEGLDGSLKVALARFLRAVLIIVALLVSMAIVHIPLTVLSVFGGALGVGLGLGLQRIASNYVSGFIILLDRSLRIGDLITVDKYNGAVTQIRTRYTVIKALDGTEAIIPNELLVSQPVLNLSYTSKTVRVAVKLQIAYDSDVDHAMELMLEAARTHARVMDEPAPSVVLSGFGVDGLDMELGIWVGDPELGTGQVRSDIGRAILAAFRTAGISIPYAHRDVRLIDATSSNIVDRVAKIQTESPLA